MTIITNLSDMMDRLGNVPLDRIRLFPPPGTATEADVLAVHQRTGLICELVEGILVAKPAGFAESVLGAALGAFLGSFVRPRRLGFVTGPDGPMRLMPGLVRIPDVAFAAAHHFPGRGAPKEPIPDLAPDLAVEVLSTSNTTAEMTVKRREYFAAGVRLVWEVDPEARTVTVYTAATKTVLAETDVLDGGDVLPGFTLPLSELFAALEV